MKVAITGATGLIGSVIREELEKQGHICIPLVRSRSQQGIFWDYETGFVDADSLEEMDVVIHLAGESIAGGRWNTSKKNQIYDSRVCGTRVLAESLANLSNPPQLFITASAIGYYGNRPSDEFLTEDHVKGSGFLSDVVEAWECASQATKETGIRTVHLRLGIVLSKDGGALKQMLLPFRLGLGGRIGSGEQMMSWVSLSEIPSIVEFAIYNPELAGPVNVVSPYSVSNREFTRILGKVLHRPTLFRIPAPVIRLLLGEMGEALLLDGANVKPEKLLIHGYRFQEPYLIKALQHSIE